MNLFQAIFLGIVQGLTEWLPISSSGHLVIFQQIFKIEAPLIFDIILHFGTLVAVLIFFRKDIWNIFLDITKQNFQSQNIKLLKFIIIGTMPIALTGYFLHDFFASLFSNLLFIGISLIFTGIILYLTKFSKEKKQMDIKDSVLIGLSQALALVPGISRSGSTISVGLLRGVDKESVYKFSFLLSIPAIIGANILGMKNGMAENIISFEMIFGMVVAGLVGYFSLKFLYNILKKEKLYMFSYYCWFVGILILTMFLFRIGL